MKNILLSTLSITGLVLSCITTTPTAAFAQAQSSGDAGGGFRFYCGQVQDPTGKKMVPATLVSVPGESESRPIVIWKSDYFGEKYPPEKRCNLATPKFQAAYQEGREYLASGTDRATGLGIVCQLASESDVCDRSKMLFTLKSYQDANAVVDSLSAFNKGDSNIPPTQSASSGRIFKWSNLRRK
jgi:Circadian oscillating protein COP23